MIDPQRVLVVSVHSENESNVIAGEINRRSVKPLKDSASAMSVPLRMFWSDRYFDGFLNIKIKFLRDRVSNVVRNFDYIMYVDAHDILFVREFQNLLDDYESNFDGKMVFCNASVENRNLHKVSELSEIYEKEVYVDTGLWLGPTNIVLKMFKDMMDNLSSEELNSRDKDFVESIFVDYVLRFPNILRIDHQNVLFQQVNPYTISRIEMINDEIRNKQFDQTPSVLHFDKFNYMKHLFNLTVSDIEVLINVFGMSNVYNASRKFLVTSRAPSLRKNLDLTMDYVKHLVGSGISVVHFFIDDIEFRCWFSEDESHNIMVNVLFGESVYSSVVTNSATKVVLKAIPLNKIDNDISEIQIVAEDDVAGVILLENFDVHIFMENPDVFRNKEMNFID